MLAVEEKDAYTHGHSRRVTALAMALARAMNLSPEEVRVVELVGILHDVGKIGIPEAILNKPGRLTAEDVLETPKAKLEARVVREQVDGDKVR